MVTEERKHRIALEGTVLRAAGRTSASIANARLAEKIRESLTRARESFEALLRAQRITPGGLDDAAVIQRELSQIQSALDSFARSGTLSLRTPIKKGVDLGSVANEALLVLASSAPKGSTFELHKPDGTLPAFADPVQISQAVSALALHLLNAGAARIELTAGRKTKDSATQSVFIEIKSDGPRFPAGHRDWLLNPLALLNHDEIAAALADARRIIDMHGGDLFVESPPEDIGHGARITLVLAELQEYHI